MPWACPASLDNSQLDLDLDVYWRQDGRQTTFFPWCMMVSCADWISDCGRPDTGWVPDWCLHGRKMYIDMYSTRTVLHLYN